jgi:hydroxypyruvate isomerase
LGLEWSGHITWLFAELPYGERVAAARAAGFSQIESAWPEPGDVEVLAAAVARSGVGVALLNVAAGDADAGERGFLGDPERRTQCEQDFLAAVELAGRVGARKLNLLVGPRLEHVGERRQLDAVAAALRDFAGVARERALKLVLEPLNTIENPGFLLPTPDAVIELLDASGVDDVELLFDAHHIACMGLDPLAVAVRHGARVGHVQLSDWPGRSAPGDGSLDLLGAVEELRACGYDDALGLEFEPDGPTPPTLAFTCDPRWMPAPLG